EVEPIDDLCQFGYMCLGNENFAGIFGNEDHFSFEFYGGIKDNTHSKTQTPLLPNHYLKPLHTFLSFLQGNPVNKDGGVEKNSIKCGGTCNAKAATVVGEVLAIRLKVKGLVSGQEEPLPLPLSSPSAKLVIMDLEEYGYQSRRGIRVPKKWRSSYSGDVIFLIKTKVLEMNEKGLRYLIWIIFLNCLMTSWLIVTKLHSLLTVRYHSWQEETRDIRTEDMNLTSRDIVVEMTISTNRDIGSSVEDLNTTKQDQKSSTASPSHSLPKLPCEDLLGRTESYFDICVPLYQASISGDWRTAKDILDTRPELVRYAIAEGNDTALHVAASAEETKLTKRFVKNMVNMMTKEDLEIQNKNDETALCLAATAGNIKMVEIMLKKNPGLLTIEGSRGMLPLYMSALQGRHNTVKYLYDASKTVSSRFWTDEKWGWMLLGCVECDFYDVALQIVKDHPELSTDMSIGVLARKSDAFKRVEKNLIRRIIHSIMSMRSAYEEDTDALKLLKIIVGQILRRKEKYEIDRILKGPPLRILFVAAEMGNTIFVIELLRAYPDLIWQKNDDGRTIFHIAVMHRHQGIYNLLYEIGSRKNRITDIEDIHDNNMLHLVALTTVKMRSHTSGASLPMQRELLWFKEVEKMLPAHMRENKNKNDQTPYELFSEMNTDLVTRGLDWMKDCMVVATLIVTVAFAVAFTVPGAYDQTHGLPIFIHHRTLLVFVIADAISLFFSSTSLLVFLSILTSRHAQRDFMYSLPKKLTIGLVTLFISVAAMMVTFSASFFVLYRNGLRWVPILIATFAALPVILFAALQYPLLWDISRSMYDSRVLVRCNGENPVTKV
nr:ankyrin repeat-containing protein [Tanacetum cinerariifolium]